MRFLAIISILCSIVATVLSILLILAGNKVGFLEDVDILTLNTTDVGKTLATSPNSPAYSAIHNPAVTSLLAANPTASALAGEIGDLAQSVAEDIGLHEFYSLHLLDYCEGYYTPSPNDSSAAKNVTFCSNNTSIWNFNLTTVLQNELKTGISLDAINWPQSVQDGLTALETAMKVMFYFYCAAAAISGVGILTGIGGLFLDGRGSACCNIVWISINVIVNIIASIIATVIMGVAVGTVDNVKDEIGIEAYKGNKFLAMTWAAVAVLIIGWLVWCVDCCVGGSRKRYRYKPMNGHRASQQSMQQPLNTHYQGSGYPGGYSGGYQHGGHQHGGYQHGGYHH